MIKMVKDYVCYKKNCYSTKLSVIDKAEKAEEEHFKEDLNKRVTPHSHNKNKPKKTNASLGKNVSKLYGRKTNLYDGKTKKKYDHEDYYLISGETSGKEKPTANLSRGHDMEEYAEFLIEFPQGKFRVSNLYRGTYGELKKKGIVPDYSGLPFDKY